MVNQSLLHSRYNCTYRIVFIPKYRRKVIFDRHPEYKEKNGRHFWARGYYCETVGNVNDATIKRYIDEQYENDRLEGE